mgnify:CR=1 FL=1
MKKRTSNKVTGRELTARTEALLSEVMKLRQHNSYLNTLINELIKFLGKTEEFQEYLSKLEEPNGEDKVRGSTNKNKASGKGKSKPAKTGGKTTVQPKPAGQEERTVLDAKQA